jgi:hypothetical protein
MMNNARTFLMDARRAAQQDDSEALSRALQLLLDAHNDPDQLDMIRNAFHSPLLSTAAVALFEAAETQVNAQASQVEANIRQQSVQQLLKSTQFPNAQTLYEHIMADAIVIGLSLESRSPAKRPPVEQLEECISQLHEIAQLQRDIQKLRAERKDLSDIIANHRKQLGN